MLLLGRKRERCILVPLKPIPTIVRNEEYFCGMDFATRRRINDYITWLHIHKRITFMSIISPGILSLEWLPMQQHNYPPTRSISRLFRKQSGKKANRVFSRWLVLIAWSWSQRRAQTWRFPIEDKSLLLRCTFTYSIYPLICFVPFLSFIFCPNEEVNFQSWQRNHLRS